MRFSQWVVAKVGSGLVVTFHEAVADAPTQIEHSSNGFAKTWNSLSPQAQDQWKDLAETTANCVDFLTTTIPGVPFLQQDTSGTKWGNGYDCKGSGEELSANDFFCIDAGWTCAAYEAKGWCADGFVIPQEAGWRNRHGLKDPGDACCACGGGMCIKPPCWFTLHGLAVDEGLGVKDVTTFHTLDECKTYCENTAGCKSLTYSAAAGGYCYMKDKCLDRNTPVQSAASNQQYAYDSYYIDCKSMHWTTPGLDVSVYGPASNNANSEAANDLPPPTPAGLGLDISFEGPDDNGAGGAVANDLPPPTPTGPGLDISFEGPDDNSVGGTVANDLPPPTPTGLGPDTSFEGPDDNSADDDLRPPTPASPPGAATGTASDASGQAGSDIAGATPASTGLGSTVDGSIAPTPGGGQGGSPAPALGSSLDSSSSGLAVGPSTGPTVPPTQSTDSIKGLATSDRSIGGEPVASTTTTAPDSIGSSFPVLAIVLLLLLLFLLVGGGVAYYYLNSDDKLSGESFTDDEADDLLTKDHSRGEEYEGVDLS